MNNMYSAIKSALSGIDAESLPAHIEDWLDTDVDDLYGELCGHIRFNEYLKEDLESHIRDVFSDVKFEDLYLLDIKEVIRKALRTHYIVCECVAEYCGAKLVSA